MSAEEQDAIPPQADPDTAVVLLNMGAATTAESIEPFLYELFADPYIIQLPLGFLYQKPLARLIAKRRAPKMAPHYARIGGSPLLPQTLAQAAALEREVGLPVTVAMRYSAPRAPEVVKELAARGIRRVVALPLYPQFSQTTSATSLDELREFNERAGLDTLAVPSYPMLPEMIDAMMRRWEEAIADMAAWPRPIHVLLTAHGVPELYVRRGDPYITEVERTARAITERLPKDLPLNVAYQSRLGPVSWVKPYLDHEAARLASEGIRTLVMFPITFVSEHIETLYELDIQVADIAKAAGVEKVVRVATVQDHPRFIEGLARLTRAALDGAP